MAKSLAQTRLASCVHADACRRLADLLGTPGRPAWQACGCESCTAYDRELCPMALAGTMRCEGMGGQGAR